MACFAVLGGTGPEGLGLALRIALAGESVLLGSRSVERAHAAADTLRPLVAAAGAEAVIGAGENEVVAREADVVVLSFPWVGVEEWLPTLAPAMRGKPVLDVVNPLQLRGGLFRLRPVEAGSAGQRIQQLLPDSPVVSGFKNLSAKELMDPTHRLQGDVLLCGDHPETTARFAHLVRRMPDLRPVDAGALANSAHLEAITALLLNLNRRHRALTSIQVLGLPAAD